MGGVFSRQQPTLQRVPNNKLKFHDLKNETCLAEEPKYNIEIELKESKKLITRDGIFLFTNKIIDITEKDSYKFKLYRSSLLGQLYTVIESHRLAGNYRLSSRWMILLCLVKKNFCLWRIGNLEVVVVSVVNVYQVCHEVHCLCNPQQCGTLL